jgi:hypothetical protein
MADSRYQCVINPVSREKGGVVGAHGCSHDGAAVGRNPSSCVGATSVVVINRCRLRVLPVSLCGEDSCDEKRYCACSHENAFPFHKIVLIVKNDLLTHLTGFQLIPTGHRNSGDRFSALTGFPSR